MSDQLMTVKQVADFLQISTDKVYSMAQQEEIPAIKVGNQWRFDREEIRRWMKENTTGNRGTKS